MARKPVASTLDASTIDILNVIRANASYEYQNLVPQITKANEVAKVGDVLVGYPALANQFLNSLMNRIALVNVKTASFYNKFAELKKGYLEFGETVEEVFVNIAKAREFSSEKAASREFKRTLPDVRTAFHVINWRVQYPVTIQDQDLRQAFTSMDGVQDLIARVVDSVYVANEYDEFLLFKYLIIKSVSAGKMYPAYINSFDGKDNLHKAATAFRAVSNRLTLMSNEYNNSRVHTVTDRGDQVIFMTADYASSFDVNVLAAAFNMDKVDFIGRMIMVDSWTSFDNERFEEIANNSDMFEPITAEELSVMEGVKAVLVDKEFFQVYDNKFMFTEDYVASGMYWNYFLNVWKTVSYSPFSNAVVFYDSATELPRELTVEVIDKSVNENVTVITLAVQNDGGIQTDLQPEFVQDEKCTINGIAVHKYGVYMIPADKSNVNIKLDVKLKRGGAEVIWRNVEPDERPFNAGANVGDTFTIGDLPE